MDDARRRADAAFHLVADHPRPRSDDAAGHRAALRAGGIGQGRPHVGRVDLDGPGRVQPAVIALADGRHERVIDPGRLVQLDERGDGRVVDATDRHRAGPQDRRLEDPPLADRGDPDRLAGAVEDGGPGRHALLEQLADPERDDGGHPGPRDPATLRGRRLVAPDRRVADANVRDVDDRIGRAGREHPDVDAQVARAGSRERRGHGHLRAGGSPGRAPRAPRCPSMAALSRRCRPAGSPRGTRGTPDRVVGHVPDAAIADPLRARHDRGMVGDDPARVLDLDDDRRWDREPLQGARLGGSAHGPLSAGADPVAGHARMHGGRAVAAVRDLDHDPLGPRQPGLDLLGQRIVARHQPDRDAPGAEDQGVQAVLTRRSSGEAGLDGPARIGVGDRASRVPGPGVVPDEQGDVECRATVRPGLGAGDHRPGLLALEDPGRRVQLGREQVAHVPVAVVDQDVVRAGGDRALDGGVRLADHELDGRGIADVRRIRRVRMADAADALHVDADVHPHDGPSSSPVRAACPTQTWPSANRSAFQIGTRAFVSSIA